MFLAFCPQVVSQAPQHFRSSETQGEHGWQKPSCVIPTAQLIDIRQGSYSRHCGQSQNALYRLKSLQSLVGWSGGSAIKYEGAGEYNFKTRPKRVGLPSMQSKHAASGCSSYRVVQVFLFLTGKHRPPVTSEITSSCAPKIGNTPRYVSRTSAKK